MRWARYLFALLLSLGGFVVRCILFGLLCFGLGLRLSFCRIFGAQLLRNRNRLTAQTGGFNFFPLQMSNGLLKLPVFVITEKVNPIWRLGFIVVVIRERFGLSLLSLSDFLASC